MIQRKQTLFLIIALVLNIVCLCLPIGRMMPVGMGGDMAVTNLWIQMADGARQFSTWFLFAILLVACPLSIMAVMAYTKRSRQAMLCLLCMLLMMLWYGGLLLVKFVSGPQLEASFAPSWTACLPFVSLVFYYLARRGVLADEALVRSMDRIR